MSRVLALAAVLLGAGVAAADPIPVSSTGTGGPTDAHYTITSAPAPYAGPAYVITTPDSAFPFAGATNSSWADNALNPAGYPASAWIGPVADVSTGAAFISPGTYTYATHFDLTGLDPATASLSGIVAADNGVDIYLNGSLVTAFQYPDGMAFTDDRFPTQAFVINSVFLPGDNLLEFRVVNDANAGNSPTGLRVALSGTADPLATVPEPMSLAVFAAGVCGLAVVRRRFVN